LQLARFLYNTKEKEINRAHLSASQFLNWATAERKNIKG
jgi:hypothetical protein